MRDAAQYSGWTRRRKPDSMTGGRERHRINNHRRKPSIMKPHQISTCLAALCLFVAGSTAAGAGNGDILEAECKTQLKLSDSACKCIGTTAEADLNDTQQDFVVAAVTKNKARMQELQMKMSQEDALKAAQFMTTAPSACGNQ